MKATGSANLKTESVTPKLWIDVEDLFEYARGNPRPSGIQRLAFELYRALQERPDAPELIRFVRHLPAKNSFRSVSWPEIEALFSRLSMADRHHVPYPSTQTVLRGLGEMRDSGPIRPHPAMRQAVRKLVHRLPPSLRLHVIEVILTQVAALRAWGKLIDALARGAWIRLRAILGLARRADTLDSSNTPQSPAFGETSPGLPDDSDQSFAALSQPGDVLLVLGSPWSHPDYAALVAGQKKRGLKFALLVYDLIPLRRPEWCDRGLVRLFRSWFESVFPLCDHVFAISQATARDVESYTRERGLHLPGPVAPIPIGTTFLPASDPLCRSPLRPLPPAGTYALIVSTIEARKNHMLLFRVWRRLLEDLEADRVPTLVFAGRVGWLVDDLMRQIANTDNLNGKLVIVENPSDSELAALYEGCLFTLFPSFFEGWGLPVSESLVCGKPCITSNSTSLPEAGGNLTRQFDPDNVGEAYTLIRATIEDRPGLARWEAQVRREFRVVPWSDSATALVTGLGLSIEDETPQAASLVKVAAAR